MPRTSSKLLTPAAAQPTQTRVPLLAVPRYCTADRIEQDLGLLLQQRPHHRARHDAGDDGAVLGRDLGEEAGGAAAAGARHVLDHDVGLAGDVAVDVARQRAAVDVVAARRTGADDEVDGPAGVVVLRRRRRGDEGAERRAERRAASRRLFNGIMMVFLGSSVVTD